MAVNYFSQLGFDQAMNRPFDVAQSISSLRTQGLNRDLATQQAEMQKQQAVAQQKKAEADQARLQLSDATGLIYSALSTGQTQKAAELAQQYEGSFKAFDPTFTAQGFVQAISTPEGLRQLQDEALQLTQVLAGPEQMARFTAQQAKASQPEMMTDYQRTQTELRKQEIDLQKEKAKLDAMMKAEQQQTNEIKKQELQLKIEQQQQKLQDAEKERETKEREKSAALESGLQSTDNLLLTLDQILATPIGVVESATGPVSTRLPTLSQGTADFEELINKFDSQAFIAQIPMLKGTGALSDSEGRKLSASLQNLSLRQSPQRLLQNVKEAKQIMDKARQNLLKKFGAEQPGQDQLPVSEQEVVDWSQL